MPDALSCRRARWLGAVLTGSVLALLASPAVAAEGSIDHIGGTGGQVQLLYSLPDGGAGAPDLSSVKVEMDGEPLKATATRASDATTGLRRTAVLAIDVSNSMKSGGKFTEAKRAAQIFLDSVPSDLYVGIVTFAGKVTVAQKPTLDRTASKSVVSGLTMSFGTLLYDGIDQAVATSGKRGQRSVIVLSDGRDTSKAKLSTVTAGIKKADVKVDVVALAQSAGETALLAPLSTAGGGAVIRAKDPKALTRVFASEAKTLADQMQITTAAPTKDSEGTLSVSVDAGGQTYTDSAFVRLPAAKSAPAASPTTKLTAPPTGFALSPQLMFGALGAVGVSVLVIIVGLFGGFGKPKESLESRIDAYTQKGRNKRPVASAQPPQGVAAQAVDIANKALKSNHGFEAKLGDRLDAAAVTLKPAEWLLVHAAIAMAVAALLFAFTDGNVAMGLLGLLGGVFVPWFWLGFRKSRRLKAFNSQLAGCLQLMAGSLKAGLSLAQGLDGIVREGQEPLSGEFRRALVETRLGVPVEVALDSVGERMESADFAWTVMAIRIQREVGGNLAELLLNVAATLREREYLRRQVKALSAEGRFSAYILLAMPPGIMLYMAGANPTYLHPLISTPVGFVMLGVMATLMVLGAVTMKKIIKVEV